MATIQKQNDAIKVSIGAIEEIKPMVVELVGWKPAVEKAVTELREEMGDLRAQVHQLAQGDDAGGQGRRATSAFLDSSQH
ncbi:hypothetical protein OsJ_33070 [Oryza sativa Japonica Group]|uniref:Uncharacterized protein n=1 Tax=Oryza sativa subsp. japonica TaxID=39947 RepID=A3C8X4_ORYSJ|nr:hypothetical protein OsJ_33070 [Oryza sativa Japonica Group]